MSRRIRTKYDWELKTNRSSIRAYWGCKFCKKRNPYRLELDKKTGQKRPYYFCLNYRYQKRPVKISIQCIHCKKYSSYVHIASPMYPKDIRVNKYLSSIQYMDYFGHYTIKHLISNIKEKK